MLTELEIRSREPYEEQPQEGWVGPYERIEAVAHYRVDPGDPASEGITDLDRAPRGADGCVRFEGDLTILQPVERGAGNGGLLLEVPNRGNRVALRSFNRAPFALEPTSRLDPGDGFLFRRGWTVAFCGWQWDVPRSPERIGLDAPRVPGPGGGELAGWVQLRLQLDAPAPAVPLTDQHVGAIGNHRPLPAADVADPDAVLLVRDGRWDEPVALPRERFRFARAENGRAVADANHVWLDGGFEPGRIYDLVYRTGVCPVVGAGLLAIRDAGAFLRRDPAAPTAGRVDHAVAEGISQCGRLLRTFLYLGLNVDEAGRPVYDGVLAHIAGGRRGEFNHRYAQPSVQPTPSFGHAFPFADEPLVDPATGTAAGLLDRQRARGGVPKIVYTDTSAEYWRGDASLSHTDPTTGDDVEPSPEVRRYLFSSTQHGPGEPVLARRSMFGSRSANWFDVVDYRPLFRAALENLAAWVRDGVEPPHTAVPRRREGTAAARAEVLGRLAAVPGLALPDLTQLADLRPLDLGPEASSGVGAYPARVVGPPYPAVVSTVDDDGNEVAGAAMPDVTVPVATHTGFNPRHPETGGAGQLLEYLGSTVPFARTAAERAELGDPRPALEERYAGRDDYLARVRRAAEDLAERRYLLVEDVDVCVAIAAERYDLVMGASRPRPEPARAG